MNKRALGILAILCVVYAMSFFHRSSPSVLSLDLMEDLQLTASTFGLLGSLTMLGYAITQIPSGILTDTIGARKTLVFYQCLAAGASICFSMSESLSSAGFSRFILGLALAANVPSMQVIASWFSAKQYSKANALYISCGSLGTLLASSPLAYITGIIGWRSALFSAGVFTFVLAILTWFFVANSPKSEEPNTNSKKEENTQESVVAQEKNKAMSTEKRNILGLIKLVFVQKNFIPAFIWFFCMAGSFYVLITVWWGAFLMQGLNFTRTEAGNAIFFMALMPLFLNPVMAILSDSVFKSRKVILFLGAIGGFIGFIPLTFFIDSLSATFVFYLGAFLLIMMLSNGSLIFTLVKESVPTECRGTAFGMINIAGPLCAFIFQNIFGLCVQYGTETASVLTGYSYAFAVLLVLAFLAILASFYIKDTYKEAMKEEA